jgi:hypothetical protein
LQLRAAVIEVERGEPPFRERVYRQRRFRQEREAGDTAALGLLAALGSVVADLTAALFVITVAGGVAKFTRTTSVNVALAPKARLGFVAVAVPVPPTGGVVTLQPAGAVSDTNVELAGITSVTLTLAAGCGPVLPTWIV